MDLIYGFNARSRFPDTSILSAAKVAELVDKDDSVILSKIWRTMETILNGYWKRFKTDYLLELRNAHERKPRDSIPLAVGDICLLNDPSPSRSFWPICRVLSLFGGGRTDLRQRSCLVKIGGKKTPVKRPISSLYPLDFGDA